MAGGAKKVHPADNSQELITILLVSDANEDRAVLQQILESRDWHLTVCSDCSEALPLIRAGKAALVLAERNLPDGNWKRLLDEAQEVAQPPVFLVASRHADEHLWAEVLNLGGYDVLLKPFNPSEVVRVVAMARRHWTSGANLHSSELSAKYVRH